MWNVALEWDRIHKVEIEEKAIPGRGTIRWKDGKQEWAECVWDSEAYSMPLHLVVHGLTKVECFYGQLYFIPDFLYITQPTADCGEQIMLLLPTMG